MQLNWQRAVISTPFNWVFSSCEVQTLTNVPLAVLPITALFTLLCARPRAGSCTKALSDGIYFSEGGGVILILPAPLSDFNPEFMRLIFHPLFHK